MWLQFTLLFAFGNLIAKTNARSMIIDLYKLETDFNPEIIRYMNVTLITFNKRRVVNGSFMFESNLDLFDMKLILQVPQNKNRKATLFNMTMDGCKFVSDTIGNALSLSYLVANVIRKSVMNLPRKCPVLKLTEIVISNLYIDTEAMPAYLPTSVFDFVITLSRKTQFVFNITAAGYVGPKRKRPI